MVGMHVKAHPLKQHRCPAPEHSLSDLQIGTLHPKVGISLGGGGHVDSSCSRKGSLTPSDCISYM